MSKGHLFAIRGDLTQFKADLIVLPTDDQLRMNRVWLPVIDLDNDGSLYTGHRFSGPVQSVTPHISRSVARNGDTVLLLDSGSAHHGESEEIARRVGQLAVAIPAVDQRSLNRERRLVAVPLFGAGTGGWNKARQRLVQAVVPALAEVAISAEVDIVLVVNDALDFAAVQSARYSLPRADADLDDRLLATVEEITDRALGGRLALFVGAGASMTIGLPSWAQLITEIGDRAGLAPGEVFAEGRDLKDAASLLESERGRTFVRHQIVDLCTAERYGLVHGLLAALPVHEYVTTNYDGLVETALEAAGVATANLRDGRDTKATAWVLPLHGDLRHPEAIVISREDYANYATNHANFAATMSAVFLTRDVVFIGFGLEDSNVVGLATKVREALHHPQSESYGIALIVPGSHSDGPWSDHFRPVPMTTDGTDVEASGRVLELLLDAVALNCAPLGRHILSPEYSEIATDGTAAPVVRALIDLNVAVGTLPSDHPDTAAVRRFLLDLGCDPHRPTTESAAPIA